MDATTLAVRAMYEEYPYPAVPEPALRLGSDPRLLLSYGQMQRSGRRPLQVLDAGCGRANGTLGGAALNRDVQFLGIDINRVTLADAAAKAREIGLSNVRFQEVDLVSLEGLEVPEGGFDLVISSGVLHHLSSPEEGLRQLRRVLAPHGMLSLLVYGTLGREPLYRTVRAIDLLIPRHRPLNERLAVVKQLARELVTEPLRMGPTGLSDLHDNELVDRYLNVNETSYDVASLFELLERNEFRFLRWVEPAEWSLPVRPGMPSSLGAGLTELQRYQLVEQISWRHQLFLIACTGENRPRELPPRDQWMNLWLALNPDVSIQIELRTLHGAQRVERIHYALRSRSPVEVTGLSASVLAWLKDQTAPFQAKVLMERLRGNGINRSGAHDLIAEFLGREILYAPHPTDV